MKKIIFMLCLFFTTNLMFGQKNIDIPKGINKIILSTELNEKENIMSIVKVLKDFDIPILKIDTISYQIQTTPKNIGSYTYSFFFNVFDKKVVVSGMYNSNTGVQVYNMVYNDGGRDIVTTKWKNTIQNKLFLKMKEIVLWVGNEKNIQYNFVN